MSTSPSSNLRGIAFMVIATGVFSTNDVLMKLATVGMPPYEVLFLRGVMASLLMLPLILLTGNGRQLRHVVDKWVVIRNTFEFGAVLCFIVALANMPIADLSALGQISPMLLLLGVALIYREKIGVARMVLITIGFAGALLVAQPGVSGFSSYALLGLVSAMCVAARDIVGRKVGSNIPAPIVAYATLLLVMVGSGITTLLFEDWVAPSPYHLLLLAGSGLFLSLGHLFIFLSYRNAATSAVAPFYYLFSVWAVLSGVFVFGTFPNTLALCGIGLIVASGMAVVFLDRRRRRLQVLA
ncbi:MAG: DMT family transporter [Devosia sp.]|uniref:DMT family transporter n=1 Tax=Devosia sp. TaxID=1871048 RepID=UPI001A379B19|nr:DMT family transporter [Devosia sp.]MBL8597713.1 DMT family transporter [Devosia sp.]